MLTTKELLQNPAVKENYEKLKDWNWRYGRNINFLFFYFVHLFLFPSSHFHYETGTTPHFNHHLETRFDWGIMVIL